MSELLFLNKKPTPTSDSESHSPRIAFVTLGCKVNQSDTQKAIADFRAAGWRIVPPNTPAEVYVVNTCSVTHTADRKSRTWLRRSARANPSALVVATGCYAESGKQTLEAMDEVGLIIGYKHKDDLLSLVSNKLGAKYKKSEIADHSNPDHTPSWLGEDDNDAEYHSRTRAMVKIEDGCNDFCTFCIIPFTRGMPRSTPTNKVIDLVNANLDQGFKEIVLTGVHMGKYGQDHAQRKRSAADPSEAPDLPGAIRAVLERTSVPRLRITSVEPTDALMLIPLLANPSYHGRLAPHLHLPLQSGCDATLARMKRDYTTAEYADVVRQVREAVPGISITADLITGFPGETDEEWQQTVDFVRSIDFARVHVFPYSGRPGTPAETMPGQIHPDIKHARTLQMMQISRGTEATYAIRHLGQRRPILWETSDEEPGGEERLWTGLTDNYLRVHTKSALDLHNSITPAEITEYDAHGLWATINPD